MIPHQDFVKIMRNNACKTLRGEANTLNIKQIVIFVVILTNSMDTNLDRGAWCTAVHGTAETWT